MVIVLCCQKRKARSVDALMQCQCEADPLAVGNTGNERRSKTSADLPKNRFGGFRFPPDRSDRMSASERVRSD